MIVMETVLLLTLALCIFIFISFFGAGGYVGGVFCDICFGLFGAPAYLFPLLLFLAVAFGISNYGNHLAVPKFIGCALLYFCICSFAALFEGEFADAYRIGKLYARCATMKKGGGVIGGTLCHFLVPALGAVGTGVVFFALVLVAIVLISQRSILNLARRGGKRVVMSARKSSNRHRAQREKKEKEKEEWDLFVDNPDQNKETAEDKKAEDMENFSILPKEPSVPVSSAKKRTAASNRTKNAAPAENVYTNAPRQLDISVLYPSETKDRNISHPQGVTRDTKIARPVDKDRAASAAFSSQELKNRMPDLTIEGVDDIDEREKEDKSRDDSLEIYQEPVKEPAPLKDADRNTDAALQEAPGTKARRNPRSSPEEIEKGIASVEAEMEQTAKNLPPEYVFPPLKLLHRGKSGARRGQEEEIRQTAAKLQQTLDSFGVHVTVTNVSCGPSVTRYELLPEQGVKVSRIVSLADDIKLNLAASDIRIEAPIPGKSAVGIEVPNSENSTVNLRDILESEEFVNHKSKLAFATGRDIAGKVVVSDIAKMPHLLIAGATGSGKSVCINTLIMSILYKATPEEVKMIMIDPKVVELSVYNGIPHLFIPVVTDPKKAAGALNWAVAEMTDRYDKFAELGVRDLEGYNQKIDSMLDDPENPKPEKLPQIVIIVDELADLMMVAPAEVEDSICRLAQLARAAGIHLVIATQRPSVNVITGLIKANMPSRIAFAVTSGVDSRTIIDMYGAEKLLGKGDMLFYPQGYQKPARVQGAFVSDEEVSSVVDFLKEKNSDVVYNEDMQNQIAKVQQVSSAGKAKEDNDELFADAGKFIIEKDKASIGMLQRVFKIGFNRAARIMDQLADAGVVGEEEGTKPRKILMNAEEFENYLEQN